MNKCKRMINVQLNHRVLSFITEFLKKKDAFADFKCFDCA